VKNALRTIKHVLAREPSIEFAYLFGSRAIGTAGSRSDWDIAVYYGKSRKISPWRRFYLEAELSRELGAEAQVIELNSLESPLLLFEVVNTGIPVTDRKPASRIIFEARVLSLYHDWRYFQDRVIH